MRIDRWLKDFRMKKIKKFKEAFKKYSEVIRNFNEGLDKKIVGSKITELWYGEDADGDAQLYYIVLDNGIKIGMARVYPDGNVKELDRAEKYDDESIIRFQFHDWPEE